MEAPNYFVMQQFMNTMNVAGIKGFNHSMSKISLSCHWVYFLYVILSWKWYVSGETTGWKGFENVLMFSVYWFSKWSLKTYK